MANGTPRKTVDKYGLKFKLSNGYVTVPIWFPTPEARKKAMRGYKGNKHVVDIISLER